MLNLTRTLLKRDDGAALVEFTLLSSLLIVATGGIVDFTFALFEWNSATKAVQQGARLAAVSSPVDSTLTSITGLGSGINPGDPWTVSFSRVCTGSNATCTGGTYTATGMNTLVYGRGLSACGAPPDLAGMCNIYPKILPANVKVTYRSSGLGFAGRPGGPVPTITVELTGLTYNLIFLGTFLGGASITLPPLSATVTGEDLKS